MRTVAPVAHTILSGSIPRERILDVVDVWPGDTVLLVGDTPEEDEVGTMLPTGELEWRRRE